MEKTFDNDKKFLSKYKDTIVLKDVTNQAQVAIIGDYQARVMTSCSRGDQGNSYGWLNYKLIESGKFNAQISVFGGEDRFWLGPEGGQFSIFFDKQTTGFDFKDWQTPPCIDTIPFELVEKSNTTADFVKDMNLTNYAGTEFEIRVNRRIELVNPINAEKTLNTSLKDVAFVAYSTYNKMTNIGKNDWQKSNGLLSIWILGMYNPSPNTYIIVPFKNIPNAENLINDKYFGKIPADRLKIIDNTLVMKGDGAHRGKIGVPPAITKPFIGSYDSERKILTIVNYNFQNETDYVNSMWEIQQEPFAGDVVNAYNDGPVNDNGDQLGPFYELESSSAARELKKGESIEHIHSTFHFEGDFELLNKISLQVLGFDLNKIN